ncbi:MAG: NADH-quinone oxidoreductase subunit L [Candidatus Poribacteria bacterium]
MFILGILILAFPITAFVIQILIGKRLSPRGAWISVLAIFVSLICAIGVFVKVLRESQGPERVHFRRVYPSDATVYLKSGEKLEGTIVERIPGNDVKLQEKSPRPPLVKGEIGKAKLTTIPIDEIENIEEGWKWIDLGGRKIYIGMRFDATTAIALLMVSITCSFITLFSIGYMHGDPRYSRFFAYLSLFSFAMLLLVLSDNLFTLFIGWELMGLCSYLLIGFWFERSGVHISPATAGTKAFMTTKIGDVLLFIGMMIAFASVGSFQFDNIFDGVTRGNLNGAWLTVAGLMIFCGAIGKSAQFPLHTWLPDAMEGPTPVSALIHAATMVAAGVFLVARMFPILTPNASLTVAYIGGFTAIFAATIAIVRMDIKRVLAYSTVSQLGYMMLGLGVGSYVAGVSHLITHGFFKALLFLGSGSVIHAVGTQDMQNMGGLRKKMPITFWTFLIGTLSISGVPFLFSGFWSKDEILGATLDYVMSHPGHILLFLMSIIAAGMTAFYMFRLVYMTFFGEPRDEEAYHHAHESPANMTIPLIVLAIFSFAIVNPLWFNEDFINSSKLDMTTTTTGHANLPANAPIALATNPGDIGYSASAESGGATVLYAAEGEHDGNAHLIAMILSIVMAGLGILFATLFYLTKRYSAERVTERFRGFYTVLWNKYYFDEIYDKLFVKPLIGPITGLVGRFDLSVIDGIVNGMGTIWRWISDISGRMDYFGVDGLVNGIASATIYSARLRRIQTGLIQNYLLLIFGGIGGLVILMLILRAI